MGRTYDVASALIKVQRFRQEWEDIEEHPRGTWCKFEDVAKALGLKYCDDCGLLCEPRCECVG